MTLPLPPSLEPGTQVSRYRVEQIVARGGMGLVYEATDVRLERRVALKVLSPELSNDANFRDRFARESRLAAAVDHPHVIPVYEADDWNGLLYIAMRFVQGVDLHTVLARSGPLDKATAVSMLTQAADALDAAHEAGLVHRDVKPGNFMLVGADVRHVQPTTHVYLTDFGLTKRASSVSGLTRTGQFLGSLHYVAPEQIRGEDVDARTDLYALACVAYELFAGHPPYERDQDAALLWAHLSTPPPMLTTARPDLPDELAEVVMTGMAKDREQRPASCGQFAAMVRAALGGLALPTPVSGTGPGTGSQTPAGPRTPVPRNGAGDGLSSGPRDTSPRPEKRHGPAPSTIMQPRRETPVAPILGPQAPAGAPGGPPGGPGGPPSGGHGSVPDARPARNIPRWAWIAAAALLVVVGVLALWRPWSESLATQRLVVIPYQADLPTDWDVYPVLGEQVFAVAGSRDWTAAFSTGDEDLDRQLEMAAAEDPDSAAFMGVDDAQEIHATSADNVAKYFQDENPEGRILPDGELEVDGLQAFAASGVFPVRDQQFRMYAVVVNEEPRAVFLFVAPNAVFDEWQPVFADIVDSLVVIA